MFHHLLLGTAAPCRRSARRRDGRIGLALNLAPHYPASDEPADPDARGASDGYVNRWFLDPVLTGSYPDDMRARYEQVVGALDFIRDGDLETIAAPHATSLGVNYYAPRVIKAVPGDTRGRGGRRPATRRLQRRHRRRAR